MAVRYRMLIFSDVIESGSFFYLRNRLKLCILFAKPKRVNMHIKALTVGKTTKIHAGLELPYE